MRVVQCIEKIILKAAEKILPGTTFDRLLIERRRRINKVTESYPYAQFYSKKKSDTKYCVVRYTMPTFGLMAAGIQYIFIYYELVERGYVPIIDIEYAYSYKQGKIGENNIWDKCFEQPIEAKNAVKQPYVLATGWGFPYSHNPKVCLAINGDENDHFLHVRKENYKKYYAEAKRYTEPIWQMKKELCIELDEEIGNKLNGHRVLGVFLREKFSKDVNIVDDIEKKVFKNHPLLPGVNEIIEIIKKQLTTWEFDMIFLSTIYEESVRLFEEEFKNKIIYIKRERMSIAKPSISSFDMNEEEAYGNYQTDLEYHENMAKAYLKEIVALSRCNYLVGGASSGMAAALVMNGGEYEDIYILEDARKIQRY